MVISQVEVDDYRISLTKQSSMFNAFRDNLFTGLVMMSAGLVTLVEMTIGVDYIFSEC